MKKEILTDKEKAWDEGYNGYFNQDCNPYDVHTEKELYVSWDSGYRDAIEDNRTADEDF